jgi:hypothetical protein
MKLTTLCLIVLAVVLQAAPKFPTCAQRRNSIAARAAGNDKIAYATYQFRDQYGKPAEPDPAIRQAVQMAAKQWIDLARNRGIQFIEYPQPAPSSISIPDIVIQLGSPELAEGCAQAYHNNSIYYSLRAVRAAAASARVGAFIFAHEFGHLQLLPDAGPNPPRATVMNNPKNIGDHLLDPEFCMAPDVNQMTVTPYDSASVQACYSDRQVPHF